MAKGVSIKVTSDMTSQIKRNLGQLAKNRVLVGIPEGSRGDGDISNAQKLWLNSHGVRPPDQWSDIYAINIAPNGAPYSQAYNQFSDDMDKDGYSAAYQMYLHSEGSPLWRIPPRPVLEPSIAENRKEIATAMKGAVEAALTGGDPTPHLNDAGMIAETRAKEWFDNPKNQWPPNSPVTIHGSKPDKNGNKFIPGKNSDHPLIDTGSMRASITHVVQREG